MATSATAHAHAAPQGFIRKYIFPGAYVPALSEVFAATERNGLWVDDAEILRLHYYYTVQHWRKRFEQNREQAKKIYDERFCRMWEMYLVGSELASQLVPLLVHAGAVPGQIAQEAAIGLQIVLAAGAVVV